MKTILFKSKKTFPSLLPSVLTIVDVVVVAAVVVVVVMICSRYNL